MLTATIERRGDTLCQSWCVVDHDPGETWYFHESIKRTTRLPAGSSVEVEGVAAVCLSQFVDEHGARQAVVEIQAPQNVGCVGVTAMGVDEAEAFALNVLDAVAVLRRENTT